MRKTMLILSVIALGGFPLMADDVPKVDASVTSLLGEGWKTLNVGNGAKGKFEAVDTAGGCALKISAAPGTWVAAITVIDDIQPGELIEFELDMRTSGSNAVTMITSGFMWGTGSPETGEYGKAVNVGNGQWQRLKSSLTISRHPVCVGFALERASAPTSAFVKNVSIRREKDIFLEKLSSLIKMTVDVGAPPALKDYFVERQKTLMELREKLALASGDKLRRLSAEIKGKINELEPVCVMAGERLNPQAIDVPGGAVTLHLYNLWSPRAVWYRIAVEGKNSPVGDAELFQEDGGRIYPLNEADLILVPAMASSALRVKAPPGEYQITFQPLDYSSNSSPIKRFMKAVFEK